MWRWIIFFLWSTVFAMAILDSISHVHLA
jgi:hypothetical protein